MDAGADAAAATGMKRAWLDETVPSTSESSPYDSTAPTSAMATPSATSPPASAPVAIPSGDATTGTTQTSKRAKFGANAGGANALALPTLRVELQKRSDTFLRAHANVYLPILPEKNHVANLLKANPTDTTEVYAYKKLAQPATIQGGTMKDYQLSGLSFMAYMFNNGQNCLLGDEMGLGKTLQTLALLAYLKEEHNITGPHLLICPLSVLGSWITEITRWLPSFKYMRFHGPMTERGRLKSQVVTEQPDLVVTTYEAYTAEAGWFKHRRWGVCVLDEGHKIKNHNAAVSQGLHGIGAQWRLLLTGTPLQNNLQELLLELIMLRRTKEGVRSELSVPRREEMTLYVPLSPAQRFWYKRLLTRADTITLSEIFNAAPGQPKVEKVEVVTAAPAAVPALETEGESQVRENITQQIAAGKAGGEGNAWMKMMNLLMQLRKCCNHPYLLPNAESEPFEVAEHLVAASSKLVLLDKLLADILPKGEKVLIFSGFTKMLDILEDFMQLRGFNPYQIYLISTRAGGLGINLTAATNVVLVDQDWNPQVDIQAISRAHRIGQTKVVQVYRLVCQDSVEEQALTRLRKKLYLSAKVMGGMHNATSTRPADEEVDGAPAVPEKSEDDAPRMTRGELAGILRGGASALAKWGSDGEKDPFYQFRDATFADLRERGRQRDEKKEVGIKVEVGEKITEEQKKQLEAEEEEAERLLLAGREAVQARNFEGAVHKNVKQSNSDIRREWDATLSRASNSRTVMIDGHAVLKETIACGSWEAVKTITSDPKQLAKLANSKKQKKKFGHEDFCMDGGDVFQSWFCSQHSCTSCSRSTQEAGGLLFRCQTCPQSFCEDCLHGEIEPVGEFLPDRCIDCIEAFVAQPELAVRFEEEKAETMAKLKEMGIEL
ncbi:hypothetical protein RQP46_011304 [Phenoliferia psychrophenolica]